MDSRHVARATSMGCRSATPQLLLGGTLIGAAIGRRSAGTRSEPVWVVGSTEGPRLREHVALGRAPRVLPHERRLKVPSAEPGALAGLASPSAAPGPGAIALR